MEWDHTLFIGHPTRFQLQPRALQYHGAPLGGARGLCPASCHQEDRDPTGSGMEKQKQDPRWLNEHRGLLSITIRVLKQLGWTLCPLWNINSKCLLKNKSLEKIYFVYSYRQKQGKKKHWLPTFSFWVTTQSAQPIWPIRAGFPKTKWWVVNFVFLSLL